jgi:hypothetical protein
MPHALMRQLGQTFVLFAALGCASLARAWDGAGHRMVTRVAVENGGDDMPAWLKEPDNVLVAADAAQMPDRWRGVRVAQLTHLNNPDHYIDLEDLSEMGMTLRTMPILRHEFVKAVTEARAKPDFQGEPVNAAKDLAKTDEYPGFLPIGTMESYGRLVGAFRMVRIFDAMRKDDPTRDLQLTSAKWMSLHAIGNLSHFVGDAAQPLHTTKHHHGWIGENPKGYTTEYSIHRYIDGDILKIHKISDSDLKAKCTFTRTIADDDLWESFAKHVDRSHAHVEDIYRMKLSGELEQAPGKELIVARLADASEELAAWIRQAWLEAAPVPKDLQDQKNFEGEKGPAREPNPGAPGPPPPPPPPPAGTP